MTFDHRNDAASGWAGWALAHPEFGVSVNPIPIRGADYAHRITACPPRFENLAASLQSQTIAQRLSMTSSQVLQGFSDYQSWMFLSRLRKRNMLKKQGLLITLGKPVFKVAFLKSLPIYFQWEYSKYRMTEYKLVLCSSKANW